MVRSRPTNLYDVVPRTLSFIVLLLTCGVSIGMGQDIRPLESQARFAFYGANAKWGFLNARGEVVIEPRYDDALDFHEGVARIRSSDRFLFIDSTGDIVFTLPEKTKNAWSASEGFVWFQSAEGKWGFCDAQKGEVVLEPHYDDVRPFSENRAQVNVGARKNLNDHHVPWLVTGGKWGYVSSTGELVVPIKYDFATDYSEGLAYVRATPQSWFIDLNGTVVVDLKGRSAGNFREGLAPVVIVGDTVTKTNFINKTGRVEFTVAGSGDEFSDGLAVVTHWDDDEKSRGYIDKQGKIAIRARFKEALPFTEGLAGVRTTMSRDAIWGKGDAWADIDKSGAFVVPARFNEIRPFDGGVAKAHMGGHLTPGGFWHGGQWVLIDRSGQILAKLYDTVR